MTSFNFVSKCGKCHPGGGPLERDRDGKRYDRWMASAASGLTPGGENGLDGDYFEARWSESGVVEADCLVCHLPAYDFSTRISQLGKLNYRWAASAGSRLAQVTGSVKAGQTPTVTYEKSRFNSDGTVTLHTVRQPRNTTCLRCHGKSDWKKRGAAYSPRTDVHLAKGMRCVDCHTAGSRASDPRIRGRERHQIGKGDDPGGFVRNDLDDTVRSCESCHADGTHGAPITEHAWLPPLHLERLACQTCHIPWRYVRNATVQASDVYNPGPHIAPAGKRIWTFYDADRAYWNHYGENTLMHITDQPTDRFRPALARYKGKIFPVNRVHAAFVGYEEKGKSALGQLRMKDFYKMWALHKKSPKTAYPKLARIRDDDGDGMIEVNRPEEIDALLVSVAAHLKKTGFSLAGRRLVWVTGDRAHYSGKEHRTLPRHVWEATAYASVFKYSHDVAPARAALGARGCTDCHSSRSDFFTRPVLVRPFGPDGRPVWAPAYQVLGISPAWVRLGHWREQWLKPATFLFFALGLYLLLVLAIRSALGAGLGLKERVRTRLGWIAAGAGLLACLLLAAVTPELLAYMTARRFALDANHFWIGAAVLCLALGVVTLMRPRAARLAGVWRILSRIVLGLVGLSVLCGVLMLLSPGGLSWLSRLAYFGFDLALALAALGAMGSLLLALVDDAVDATWRRAGSERAEAGSTGNDSTAPQTALEHRSARGMTENKEVTT